MKEILYVIINYIEDFKQNIKNYLCQHLRKILRHFTNWSNTIVLNEDIEDVRTNESRKRWPKLDVLDTEVQKG